MSVDDIIIIFFKIVTFSLLVFLVLISSFSVNWHFGAEIITVVLFLCAYSIILTLPIKRFKFGLSGFEGELERLIKEKVTSSASPETAEVEEEMIEFSQDLIEPDTVLLRLSIEIEKTLRSIAESKGLARIKISLGQLTRILQQKQIISDPWLIDALHFFRKYRNELIHEGKTADIQAGINVGREVLVKLKQIQKKKCEYLLNDKITPNETLEKLGKLPKREDMSEQDKNLYSEVGSALLSGELENLINSKQWMSGIIVTALMLDFVGKTRLIWHHNGSVTTRTIEKYTFFKTINKLRQYNIIDEPTYNKMQEIKNVRNSFAHDLLRQWSVSLSPNPKLEKLIRDGIKIITTLF